MITRRGKFEKSLEGHTREGVPENEVDTQDVADLISATLYLGT